MNENLRNYWNQQELVSALGELLIEVCGTTQEVVGPVLTDSRRITHGSVFVALRGERFDGHDYAVGAVEQGAAVLIVERRLDVACLQLIVTDTAQAYGALARFWRRKFSVPVVCVVGANGKTTTTQMMASVLRAAYGDDFIGTQGNFNNAVGVPMTLLRFVPGMKAAVVEAGISHPGEMAAMIDWIRPDVVIVTNAQREHQEFLDGVEGSARENGLAIVGLRRKGCAVLPAADGQFGIWRSLARARGCRVVTYAANCDEPADVVATSANLRLSIRGRNVLFAINMQVAGQHVMHDATAVVAASLALGLSTDVITRGLSEFLPVAGRGVRHALATGGTLVDDAYNANPDSVRAAIDVLGSMPPPRILALGDMSEVGEQGPEFHREVIDYALEQGIDRVMVCGEMMSEAASGRDARVQAYASRDALIESLRTLSREPGSFWIKASHSQGFEHVVRALVSEETNL